MNQQTSIESDIESDLQASLKRDFPNAQLRAPGGLRDAMKAAERPEPARYVTRQAVLTRAAEALHRVEQLTIQIEHAAEDLERQLTPLKGKL